MRRISTVVICIFFAIQSLAWAVPHKPALDVQKVTCDTVQSPSDSCPCKDHHESRQCDTSCTCCSSSAALTCSIDVHSPLFEETFLPSDPPFLLPQVYLPIFVPPQNSSLTNLCLRSEECITLCWKSAATLQWRSIIVTTDKTPSRSI